MSYKVCENCGTRLYSGLCSSCEEELVIYNTDPYFLYSEEFMEEVNNQKIRKNRETFF